MSRIYTENKHGKEARDAMMSGAKQVFDLVSTTQGPRGRNIAINKGFDIEVLHDGLKVSRYVNPKDRFENIGASLIKEAAEKQVTAVGDGTTLTVVLGYSIAEEAMVLVDAGVNPMALVKGLEKGRDVLIEEVKRLAKPVKTQEEKVQVATVSSEDEKLGKMIGETYHKIGVEGVITADESKSHETTLEHQEGISIDHGFLSPYFITDVRTLTATVKEARILFLDREISDVFEIADFAKNVLEPAKIRNLVIVAKDVTGTALSSLIETKRKGMMNILCVKSPSFGKYQREMLEDLAVMCGGIVVDEVSGKSLREIDFEYLGFADVVKSSVDSTTIIGNKGTVKSIKERLASVRLLLQDQELAPLDEEKLKERLSKMIGGVYVIKTGGATELEMNERKERVDDAIKATKVAIQGGIVPGGEVTFLAARQKLVAKDENEEFAYRILSKAVQKPFDKLLQNAGVDSGYFSAKLEREEFGFGYNVVKDKIENLFKNGVVDPAFVLTEALRSAVSVAIMLITSDGASVVLEEKDGQ